MNLVENLYQHQWVAGSSLLTYQCRECFGLASHDERQKWDRINGGYHCHRNPAISPFPVEA